MNAFRLMCCTIFLVLISNSVYGNGPIYYSISTINWDPYWLISDQNINGILSDVMKELDRRLPYSFLASQPLPIKRAKLKFTQGDPIIECCVNITWRESLDSGGKTLWTDSVMVTEEIIIFPIGQSFPVTSIADLKGKTIATILGYGYSGDDKFIRHDVQNNIAQLRRLVSGKSDAAIIDRLEFFYVLKHKPKVQDIKDKFELGPVIGQSTLKMRIHSTRSDLLAPVNRVIKEMKVDGTIDKIVNSYIN